MMNQLMRYLRWIVHETRELYGRRELLLLAVLASVALLSGSAYAQDQGTDRASSQATSENARLIDELEGAGAKVAKHSETGEVRFIGTSKGRAIGRPERLDADAPAVPAARAHLANYDKLFGIRDEAQELRTEKAKKVGKGRSVVRFQQVYKDVPVLGGELNVNLDGSNNLLVANGEVLPDLSLDVDPGVDAQKAQETALEKIAKDRKSNAGDLQATEPELWIYDPSLLGGPGPRVPSLVWRMDVTPREGVAYFRELVLVDARRGSVALNFNQTHSALDRETYTANNGSTLPGTLVCDESAPCNSTDADAVAAHQFAGETYDFYSNNHGRDSVDDAGLRLTSTVDFCPPNPPGPPTCPFQNATWNGQQMIYGDGWTVDDIVGHELTHGVTQFESGLFYYYQSGAINESFSDIWGEFVDLSNTAGTDTAATRWLIGEDIPGRGTLRDMENPQDFDQPNRMTSGLYFGEVDNVAPFDGNGDDSGGVHFNSGVNNKAAYLLTDGGAFEGKTVTGLGINKVASIYYEAQTNLLTSASDYQDLHALLQQACTNLTGTSGITAADCQEVKDAVDATEMNLEPANAPASEARVCDTSRGRVTTLFSDNMENTSSNNWTFQSGDWSYENDYATSGTNHLWGRDQASITDTSATKASNVRIPANSTAYLRFRHAFGFEDGNTVSTNRDGGVLEYSTDNGSTWQDAGPLGMVNGYNGTMASGTDNPLAGRQGFVAESHGYISSRVNLSSLAVGNDADVRFRFRIGTNGSVGDSGWYVDDVSVYTCANLPPVAREDSYTTDEDTPLNQPAPGVLANDTDPDGDDLTAALLDNVAHGNLTFRPDGSFSYAPDQDFFGTDSFTYKVNDGAADSGVTKVTITVNPVNDPPTVEVATGGTCGQSNERRATINLTVEDVDNPVAGLTLSASSDNTRLVRKQDITFSGTGATRTMTVIALDKRSGTANITVTVSDGTASNIIPLLIPVKVGTPQSDLINGTSDADIILGLAGINTLNGEGGNDLLCGGNSRDTLNGGLGDDTLDGANGDDTLRGEDGNDTLRGGQGNDRLEGGNHDDTLTGALGVDFFSGGPGTDSATDFNATEGDTKDTTIP
jgi:bacillolysin